MSAQEAGRFALFTEREKAMISLGLVLSVVDALYGIAAGPYPPERGAEVLEVVTGLMNEIGSEFGVGPLNPSVIEDTLQLLRSRA